MSNAGTREVVLRGGPKDGETVRLSADYDRLWVVKMVFPDGPIRPAQSVEHYELRSWLEPHVRYDCGSEPYPRMPRVINLNEAPHG